MIDDTKKEAEVLSTKSLPAANTEEVKKDVEVIPSKTSQKSTKSKVRFKKSVHDGTSKKSVTTVKETATNPNLAPTQPTDTGSTSGKKSKSHHNPSIKAKGSKSSKGSLAGSASKPRVQREKSKPSTTGKKTD